MPSRRAFLTGAASAGLLAGCTETSTLPPPRPDADEVLANELQAAVSALVALIDAVGAGRPRRIRRLAPTRAVHAAHLDLLAPGTTPTPASPFVGADRAAYLAVAAAQDSLGRTLRGGVARAESGPFARVLASMAAGTAQQAVLVRRLA